MSDLRAILAEVHAQRAKTRSPFVTAAILAGGSATPSSPACRIGRALVSHACEALATRPLAAAERALRPATAQPRPWSPDGP